MSSRTLGLPDDVQRYLLDIGVREAPLLARLREETAALPEANMQISPEQGQLLDLLIRVTGARLCVEVGVFTGYSSLVTALALPADGRLVACDVSEEYTAIARPYWEEAGVSDRIDLRIAPALETLDAMLAEGGAGTVDFVFIDADKEGYGTYYERALALLRPGGLVAADNTLWGGSLVDPDTDDPDCRALIAFNRRLHGDERVDISLVPVGDGLTLARKR